jgi:ribosome-associated protein
MRRRELPGGLPPPTKGELKRQALAVQDLADRLIDAPESVAAGIDLPEKLADAIALARRITSHAALCASGNSSAS